QAQADRVLRSGLSAAIAGASGSPARRLDPTDVAAAPPTGGPAAPPVPSFPGVGPCDDPGSGCQGPLVPASLPPSTTPPPPAPPVVVVPPPNSPCGAPGFPCR
ncbi:MAG: hypothetical protein QNK05_21310, partial [Myxococcota bacterium]|nr:hypothetical protein [Myxococcota bacterium]